MDVQEEQVILHLVHMLILEVAVLVYLVISVLDVTLVLEIVGDAMDVRLVQHVKVVLVVKPVQVLANLLAIMVV